MDASLIVAIISATMQAVDLWKTFRDRSKVKEAIDSVTALQRAPTTKVESDRLLLLIPNDLFETFSDRVKRCFNSYKEVLNDNKYLPGEIDDATEAVKRCVCRELKRLCSLNGNIPDGILKQWWDQYQCEV